MPCKYRLLLPALIVSLYNIEVNFGNTINDKHVIEDDELTEQLRRDIAKDIVVNTVKFLRTSWIDCMLHGNGTRARRHISRSHLEHQLDMDILHNTKQFLTEKLLLCKLQLNSRGKSADQFDSKFKAKIHHRKNNVVDKHIQGLDGSHDPWRAKYNVNNHVDKKQQHGSSPGHVDVNHKVIYQFKVDQRTVSCQELQLQPDNKTIVCRNLWINNHLRFPNYYLCPEYYHPDDWTSVKALKQTTLQVLDLKSFCDVLGRQLNIWAIVSDIKVVWNCEDTKRRASFVNYKWSGYVEDNGFLQDLQCTYNSVIDKNDILELRVSG